MLCGNQYICRNMQKHKNWSTVLEYIHRPVIILNSLILTWFLAYYVMYVFYDPRDLLKYLNMKYVTMIRCGLYTIILHWLLLLWEDSTTITSILIDLGILCATPPPAHVPLPIQLRTSRTFQLVS